MPHAIPEGPSSAASLLSGVVSGSASAPLGPVGAVGAGMATVGMMHMGGPGPGPVPGLAGVPASLPMLDGSLLGLAPSSAAMAASGDGSVGLHAGHATLALPAVGSVGLGHAGATLTSDSAALLLPPGTPVTAFTIGQGGEAHLSAAGSAGLAQAGVTQLHSVMLQPQVQFLSQAVGAPLGVHSAPPVQPQQGLPHAAPPGPLPGSYGGFEDGGARQ